MKPLEKGRPGRLSVCARCHRSRPSLTLSFIHHVVASLFRAAGNVLWDYGLSFVYTRCSCISIVTFPSPSLSTYAITTAYLHSFVCPSLSVSLHLTSLARPFGRGYLRLCYSHYLPPSKIAHRLWCCRTWSRVSTTKPFCLSGRVSRYVSEC